MEEDKKTFAARTLETKLTEKADEQRAIKFCSDAANDERFPEEARSKAKNLYDEFTKLPKSSTSLKALLKRMEKFRKENQ